MATTTARTGVEVLISAIDAATEPIRRVNAAINSITAPAKRIGAALSQMVTQAGIPRLLSALSGVGSALARVGTAARTVALRVMAMGAAVVGAVAYIVGTTSDFGEEMFKASQKVGIGVKALSALNYAASLVDVSQEQLTRGLVQFNKQIIGVQTGSKPAILAFSRMGIHIRDAAGHIKPTRDLLGEVAEVFSQMPDGAAKTAMAVALFGRAGAELIPLLNQGRAGLDEAAAEAERLGIALDDDTAKMGAEFQDNWKRFLASVRGLTYAIGRELMPPINDLMMLLREWIADNRELIASKVHEWALRFRRVVDDLLDPTSKLRTNLANLWDKLREGYQIFADASEIVGGPLNAALLLLAGITFAPLIAALVALGGALATLGVVLLTTPIGWFLGAIAILVGAAFLIVKHWTPIKAFFIDLWAGIVAAFDKAISWIKTKMADLVSWVARQLASLLSLLPDSVAGALGLSGAQKGLADLEARLRAGAAAAAPPPAATAPGAALPPTAAREPTAIGALPYTGTGTLETWTPPPPALPGLPLGRRGPQGPGTVNYNVTAPITINAAPGMSEDAVAKKVQDGIQQSVRQIEADRRAALHD